MLTETTMTLRPYDHELEIFSGRVGLQDTLRKRPHPETITPCLEALGSHSMPHDLASLEWDKGDTHRL